MHIFGLGPMTEKEMNRRYADYACCHLQTEALDLDISRN